MYIPAAFAESDLARLHDLIQQHSFGLLVSQHEGRPFASHLPILLDRKAGPSGTLIGHMARANPQWQSAAGQEVLAVFSGPHAYISPTWYEADHVVPTWNYVAVHAHGTLSFRSDAAWLLENVRALTEKEEAANQTTWHVDDAPPEFVQNMMKAIVGVELTISQ